MPVTNAAVVIDSRKEEIAPHTLVADLHEPNPWIFWTDLLGSALVGWSAFVAAVLAPSSSVTVWLMVAIAAAALYRGLCFTHELTHLRRRALPGFETAWNLLFGVPLLLPSFTYVGVHQSHHSLATYGTKDDPEYLPFARSRRLIWVFALQSSLVIPAVVAIRFLLLAPFGLIIPAFHRWLETYATSFSFNPHYRRVVSESMSRAIRRWELVTVSIWCTVLASIRLGVVPARVLAVWFGVLMIVSFVNTLRVLGAHEYESDGQPRDRDAQLRDSIDTPGRAWTELWAPVGLRYHALHHYFPGIPYHNLGEAYRRIVNFAGKDSPYCESTSPSLPHSLHKLYSSAKHGDALHGGW